MKRLCYDYKLILTEDFLATHDRIQGTESGIIERNGRCWNTFLQQSLEHCHRFVIINRSIVATENQMINLTFFIKFSSCFDSFFKEWVRIAFGGFMTCSQYQRNPMMWYLTQIRKYSALCTSYNP